MWFLQRIYSATENNKAFFYSYTYSQSQSQKNSLNLKSSPKNKLKIAIVDTSHISGILKGKYCYDFNKQSYNAQIALYTQSYAKTAIPEV